MLPDKLILLFITKTQFLQMKVLKEMKHGAVSIKKLEDEMDLTKRQARKILQNLMTEYEESGFSKKTHTSLILDKDELRCVPQLIDTEYLELINIFQERYFAESNLYQTLLYMLEKRKFSVSDIAKYLIYSESHVYKLLGKLKELFQLLKIDIRLMKINETLIELAGSESTIRMLHYLSIAVISKGNYWLFKTITQEEVTNLRLSINFDHYQNLSPLGKKRINYLLAVSLISLKNGYQIHDLPLELVELGETVYKEEMDACLEKLTVKKMIDGTNSRNECIHFAFLSNYFAQDLNKKEEKEELGRKLGELKKNSIVTKCKKLLTCMIDYFHIPETIFYQLLYYLTNKLVTIHHLELYKFMPIYHDALPTNRYGSYIERCIDKNLKSYQNEPSYNHIKNSFVQVILGNLVSNSLKSEHKVYVEFFNLPESKNIVENVITNYYNNKRIKIVESYHHADIVISDTHGYEDKDLFYFKHISDKDSWTRLGSYFNKVIVNTYKF